MKDPVSNVWCRPRLLLCMFVRAYIQKYKRAISVKKVALLELQKQKLFER